MITLEKLEEHWKNSPGAQAECEQFFRTPAWDLVSSLVAARFIRDAAPGALTEPEAVLNRRLMRQVGALAVIEKLQKATKPKTEAWEPPDQWEYSPDTNKPTS